MTLTEAGAAVLALARDVLSTAERAAEAARAKDAEVTLRFHDLRSESPAIHRMLSRFTRDQPRVGLQLTDGGEHDPSVALRTGTVDAGVVYDFARVKGLEWSPFASIEWGVFAHSTHRFASSAGVNWTDLDGEHLFVAPMPGPEPYNVFIRARCAEVGARVVEHLAPANRSAMLTESLIAGPCLAILPKAVIPAHPALSWTPMDPRWVVQYGVTWRRDSANPAVHQLARWLARVPPGSFDS